MLRSNVDLRLPSSHTFETPAAAVRVVAPSVSASHVAPVLSAAIATPLMLGSSRDPAAGLPLAIRMGDDHRHCVPVRVVVAELHERREVEEPAVQPTGRDEPQRVARDDEDVPVLGVGGEEQLFPALARPHRRIGLSIMTTWSPVIRVIVSCPGLAVEGEVASDAWTVLSTSPTTTTPIPIFLPERT